MGRSKSNIEKIKIDNTDINLNDSLKFKISQKHQK